MLTYLSYAAFVYYAKNHNFQVVKHGDNSLSLNYEGGNYYPCQIIQGKVGIECGYVTINNENFQTLFGNDEDNRELLNYMKFKNPNGSIEHCHLPEHLWGKIETVLRPGDTINCQKKNPIAPNI
jgi:hypothetical protein